MKPRKGHSRERSRSNPAGRSPQQAFACAACGAAPPADARFCPQCGAPLSKDAASPRRKAARRSLVIYAVAAVSTVGAAVTAALITLSGSGMERLPAAPRQAPAVDLSSMPPQEAADRLFNRVMLASESGNVQEAQQFAPMAIEAYARVQDLDADAHYHLGLLHLVAGHPGAVRAEIETLRRQVPRHLLALLLEHDLLRRQGDEAAAAGVVTAFHAAYEAEIAEPRPEYEAHRSSIERFRTQNAAGQASSTAASTGVAQAEDAAGPFERRCASCHGRDAAGTERGPPLVHRIYEPGHHADAAFYRAVRQGVPSHHWSFGDMPPIPGVADEEIAQIVAYVRALQRDSGIQ